MPNLESAFAQRPTTLWIADGPPEFQAVHRLAQCSTRNSQTSVESLAATLPRVLLNPAKKTNSPLAGKSKRRAA